MEDSHAHFDQEIPSGSSLPYSGLNMSFYYMNESASKQDEANPLFWLATSRQYEHILCARDFPHPSHRKKVILLALNCYKSLIDQAYSVNMAGY